jgi:hypothetical protein
MHVGVKGLRVTPPLKHQEGCTRARTHTRTRAQTHTHTRADTHTHTNRRGLLDRCTARCRILRHMYGRRSTPHAYLSTPSPLSLHKKQPLPPPPRSAPTHPKCGTKRSRGGSYTILTTSSLSRLSPPRTGFASSWTPSLCRPQSRYCRRVFGGCLFLGGKEGGERRYRAALKVGGRRGVFWLGSCFLLFTCSLTLLGGQTTRDREAGWLSFVISEVVPVLHALPPLASPVSSSLPCPLSPRPPPAPFPHPDAARSETQSLRGRQRSRQTAPPRGRAGAARRLWWLGPARRAPSSSEGPGGAPRLHGMGAGEQERAWGEEPLSTCIRKVGGRITESACQLLIPSPIAENRTERN